VDDFECVARLLHSRINEPEKLRFNRKELFPNGNFNNTCGLSDGCSLVRSTMLSEDHLRKRSEEFANLKPGRSAEGAVTTSVGTLRRIRLDGQPDKQQLKIYDDPTDDDPLHCVLRGNEQLDRSDQSAIITALIQVFSEHIRMT
jgi:hypothetical protein